mgnify:CR=1 FL=1
MSDDVFWMALALVLVLEGLMPALNPQGWRNMFARLLQLDDQQLRTAGLISMVVGLVLLWFCRATGA